VRHDFVAHTTNVSRQDIVKLTFLTRAIWVRGGTSHITVALDSSCVYCQGHCLDNVSVYIYSMYFEYINDFFACRTLYIRFFF
jgi:hypothetical protein